MNTKTTIVILIILLVLVGWFAYDKGFKKGTLQNQIKNSSTLNSTNNPNTTADTNASRMLQVSFICKNNSHFIAEFPNDTELRVIVDGNLVRTLPRVTGDGQRFEDSTYIYVFAGEEASVTNKMAKAGIKTTTCEQPRDPNNAPMNFGDAGEGGAGFYSNTSTKQGIAVGEPYGGNISTDIAQIVSESIVGVWKSTQDSKFTREFTNAGVIIDYYEGKAVTTGTWVAFTNQKPLKVSFPLEKEAVYIQMTTVGNQAGIPDSVLNFKLTKLTPESLELIYMDRGGINTFTRIK